MKTNWARAEVMAWIKTGVGEPPSISGAEGDQTAKHAEESQFKFSTTLQNALNVQFGAQKATLDFLSGKLTAAINNPQGMSPEALVAARTQATQQTATDY
jgi:hypothetical protein